MNVKNTINIKSIPVFILTYSLLFFAPLSLATSGSKYTGAESCKTCHEKEYQQWQGSHHDLAMQEANERSVLGNFNNQTFSKKGSVSNRVISTFFKKNNRFMVNTEGADGQLHDFEISYTFGVYPLQQYMVKFPQGKIQVLDIAWDSRTKEQGGQRWFSLHPDESIAADDVLHWTGPNLNWNYMCADCHSTNLKKNYSEKDKKYTTQWDAINVSCEACHGPATGHLSWAQTASKSPKKPILSKKDSKKGFRIDLKSATRHQWDINKKTGLPQRSDHSGGAWNRTEVTLCAKCHSRRSQLDDQFEPGDQFSDHYRLAMLTDSLYHPDGKIDDEVYVYGSFIQSRMYQAGVTCSDCHNPHTLELKVKGDTVCLQCHTNEQYSTTKHHFHQAGSKGSQCISCHMPAKTYMGVDVRNDHSFRIPRPDIAQQFDLPDACSNCHTDKKSQWAVDAIKQWQNKTPEGYQQFAPALYGLNHQTDDALAQAYKLLLGQAPDIARATVVGYLGQYPSQQTLTTSIQMLRSEDADIRRQALLALEGFPVEHTIRQIFPKLTDPIKLVRIEAARILSALPQGNLDKEQSKRLNRVISEYKQTLLFVAERPEAQLSLAQLYQNQGQNIRAEKALKEALLLQAQYVPAYIQYAQFLYTQNRDKEAFKLLNKGLSLVDDAALHHSLGLWFVRNKKMGQGIEALKKAVEIAPDNARYQYIYAIAIADTQLDQTIQILERLLTQRSGHLDTLSALTSYYKQMGNDEKARIYFQKIQEILSVKLQ